MLSPQFMNIYEKNDAFSSIVRSNYLEVVNTYTHTAQTSNTPTIKKNMIYNITYHGTNEIKLKKNATVLHTFKSDNRTYQWTLDQATPTGDSTYKMRTGYLVIQVNNGIYIFKGSFIWQFNNTYFCQFL